MNHRAKPLVSDAFYLKLLKNIKRSIREVQGSEDAEVKSYYRSYASFLERSKAFPSDLEAVIRRSEEAGVLLVGDFHTLWQAQRQFIKILEALGDRGKEPLVLLEMADAGKNRVLKMYLEGKISEKEYLDKSRYFSSWGFDFSHYGPILSFLKSRKIESHGINKSGTLRERDSFMAGEIFGAHQKSDRRPVIVLVGDLHIAPAHIPRELSRLGLRAVTLYQNSESVILRRMKDGKDPYEFFQLSENDFLVNNTPPWIKMQSYLTWLEHGGEQLYAMYGYAPQGEEDEEEEIDLSATVQNYIIALKDIFSLHNKKDDDFQVYSMADLSFLDDKYFRKEPGKSYAGVIRNARSIFLTRDNTIYTVFPDVNHTVEESMHYLMGKDLPAGDGERDFWERIHYFASGYLASKMINPMRETLKRASLKEILERIGQVRTEKERRYLLRQAVVCNAMAGFFNLAMKDRLTFLELQQLLRQDKETVFELSRAIGYQVGEALFADYDKGELSGRDLKHCMFTTKEPFEACNALMNRLKKMNFSCDGT
jgi:hypothetical protein